MEGGSGSVGTNTASIELDRAPRNAVIGKRKRRFKFRRRSAEAESADRDSLEYRGRTCHFYPDGDGFWWVDYDPPLPRDLDLRHNKSTNRGGCEAAARAGVDAALAREGKAEAAGDAGVPAAFPEGAGVGTVARGVWADGTAYLVTVEDDPDGGGEGFDAGETPVGLVLSVPGETRTGADLWGLSLGDTAYLNQVAAELAEDYFTSAGHVEHLAMAADWAAGEGGYDESTEGSSMKKAEGSELDRAKQRDDDVRAQLRVKDKLARDRKSAARRKPATPQVPAIPGTTPLGFREAYDQFVVDKVLGDEQGIKIVSFREDTSGQGDYCVVRDPDGAVAAGAPIPKTSEIVSTHSSFNDALQAFQVKVAELTALGAGEPTPAFGVEDPAAAPPPGELPAPYPESRLGESAGGKYAVLRWSMDRGGGSYPTWEEARERAYECLRKDPDLTAVTIYNTETHYGQAVRADSPGYRGWLAARPAAESARLAEGAHDIGWNFPATFTVKQMEDAIHRSAENEDSREAAGYLGGKTVEVVTGMTEDEMLDRADKWGPVLAQKMRIKPHNRPEGEYWVVRGWLPESVTGRDMNRRVMVTDVTNEGDPDREGHLIKLRRDTALVRFDDGAEITYHPDDLRPLGESRLREGARVAVGEAAARRTGRGLAETTYGDIAQWERAARDRGWTTRCGTNPETGEGSYYTATDAEGNQRGEFDAHSDGDGTLRTEAACTCKHDPHLGFCPAYAKKAGGGGREKSVPPWMKDKKEAADRAADRWAGTVSHATMRNEDLIPAFARALREMDSEHAHGDLLSRAGAFSGDFGSEEASDLTGELMDALDGLAPEGYYFGANEGDGADYGFWPVADDDDFNPSMGESAQGVNALEDVIREPYAWPGGYPKFLVMSDGGAICKDCARTEAEQLRQATAEGGKTGWEVEGSDVNYEDAGLTCDNCGKPIESAYGEGPAKGGKLGESTWLGADRGTWVGSQREAGSFSKAEAGQLASQLGGRAKEVGRDVWVVTKAGPSAPVPDATMKEGKTMTDIRETQRGSPFERAGLRLRYEEVEGKRGTYRAIVTITCPEDQKKFNEVYAEFATPLGFGELKVEYGEVDDNTGLYEVTFPATPDFDDRPADRGGWPVKVSDKKDKDGSESQDDGGKAKP